MEYNTQGTNSHGQPPNSEHLPMAEQMLCILKASTKSHCTYFTAHHPSAQTPSPFSHLPSAPVLSKASEHYSEILPRYFLGRRRDLNQHHPSGRDTYLLSLSCLNDWYWFQNTISFGFSFFVLFPFCRQDMGKELTASSKDGWMDLLCTSASCWWSTPHTEGLWLQY